MPRLTPLLIVLLALPGCEFWLTPPPDPALDGLLSCSEDQPLDGTVSGDAFAIDAEGPIGLRISTRFSDPNSAGILRTDGAAADNLAEWWDPVSESTVLTGSLEAGQGAVVDLFAAGGVTLGGSLVMECPVAELCWNLGDDNGDGLIDCADPLCARAASCVADQEDLETVSLTCSDDFVSIEPPTLGQLDDQRTLYTTRPLGDVQPIESFWGGAEVALRLPPPTASSVSVRVGSAGLVCSGTEGGATVFCDAATRVSAGDVVEIPLGTSTWLEPLGAAWESIEIHTDCSESTQ